MVAQVQMLTLQLIQTQEAQVVEEELVVLGLLLLQELFQVVVLAVMVDRVHLLRQFLDVLQNLFTVQQTEFMPVVAEVEQE